MRGDKIDVEKLEQEWDIIATHTGWKLEEVYRYIGDSGSNGGGGDSGEW